MYVTCIALNLRGEQLNGSEGHKVVLCNTSGVEKRGGGEGNTSSVHLLVAHT